MTYQLSDLADDDFENIGLYTFNAFGEEQFEKYVGGLHACMLSLCDAPAMGVAVPELGQNVRRHQYERHMIYYLIKPSGIWIVRILHERMDAKRYFP